jgi:hypothetical protein
MSTTDAPEIPDWIYPGAEVVAYESGRDRNADPVFYTATVAKVAKLSFVITFQHRNGSAEERIRFRDMESKRYGGSWSWWSYRVVQPTDEIVARMAARKARNASRYRARVAMHQLVDQHRDERMDDLDLIRAAIKALAAHADLVLDQDGATDENPTKD